jgi:signal transduction histidine kinase/DNA-binding LytR/AlgR family response regulator
MDEKYKLLLEQNNLYKKLLKSLPDFLAYKNINGVYELVSETVDTLFQTKFSTIEGKTVQEVYSKKRIQDILDLDQEVLKHKRPVHSIIEIDSDNGTMILDSTRTPIFDDDGTIIGIASMSKSIDEFAQLSNRMEQMTMVQTVIMDIAKAFVEVTTKTFDDVMTNSLQSLGDMIHADRAYIFEYNFSENTMDNTHEWCNEGIESEMDNLQGIPVTFYLDGLVTVHRAKQSVLISDIQLEDPNSNLYKVLNIQGIKSLLSIPIFVEQECVGYFGFEAINDKQDWSGISEMFSILPELFSSVITQNKILRELEHAKLQAQEASTIQSDFIAKVTHELRTPINGVSNALYLLQDSQLSEDQIQYTDVMEYSLEVLGGMVNNILDYSKIEKSKLQFKSSDINLENELIKLIRVNKYMANSKGLGLYLNYDYSIPTIVSADIEKLRQILNNLIVNAIKYTNYGHVEIKVTALLNEYPYTDVRFEIMDTGIGISQENQNHIFEEFYQVGDSLNKKPEGTGLGLTITKEFLQFLKTELEVHSVERQGSTFSFDLKFFSPSDEKRQSFNKSALLVDLSEGEHSNTVDFLKAHYGRVDVCNVRNCRLAIREAYDIVFVYTNDGATFTDKIAKILGILAKVGNRMKKVLLYDDVKSQEFVDSFECFDCSLEVPSSSEVLIERLTTCGTKVSVSKEIEGTSHNRKQKILLVDDNNINRRVMGELLKGMYLDVTEAKDGYEAIELVKQESFNMIFMDIFMPGIDGYETTKRIRELDGTRGSIPIIAVTANDIDATREKMVEYGMNGVLSKPLRKDNLEKLLNEYFTSIINGADDLNDGLKVFDKDEFELFYEEDFLRKEILNTFFQDKQNDLDRISNAFNSKECVTIHKALHYMKGSFTYLKATKILKITQQILDYTEDNKLSDVLLLEGPLLQNYDLLLKELEAYYNSL